MNKLNDPKTVQKEEKKQTTKKITRKTQPKPQGFKETETLAKGLLEASGSSYFHWLHEQHQEIILQFTLENKKEIADLAREEK